MTKWCNSCQTDLPLDQFCKNCRSKDGLNWKCKTCTKNYLKENKEHIAELRRIKNKEEKNIQKRKEHWIKVGSTPEKKEEHFYRVLFKNFGITKEKYQELLKRQNYVCALCKQPETAGDPKYNTIRSLAVDHDHETGEIRGLLCSNCNLSIGILGNSLQEILNKLKTYKNNINTREPK